MCVCTVCHTHVCIYRLSIRIKKELLKECKGMGPGERVMIVGNSREPFTCAKKDEKALMSFWSKHIFLPPPDYASRKVSAMSEEWYK